MHAYEKASGEYYLEKKGCRPLTCGDLGSSVNESGRTLSATRNRLPKSYGITVRRVTVIVAFVATQAGSAFRLSPSRATQVAKHSPGTPLLRSSRVMNKAVVLERLKTVTGRQS